MGNPVRVYREDITPIKLSNHREECPFCGDEEINRKCVRNCSASQRAAYIYDYYESRKRVSK